MTPAILGAAVAVAIAAVLSEWPRRRLSAPNRLPHVVMSPRVAGAVLLLGVAAIAPVLVPLPVLAWWARRHLRRRRTAAARTRDIRRALPDVVDLLALASTAGLSLPLAHPLVAAHVPPPVGPALVAADVAALAGRPRADALRDHLSPLGDRPRALAQVLGDHLRYGVPLLPALDRIGLELRLDRRRAAEVDARRVPVRLLAPLVACVLPAFALLTVVPLLAASLDALPT